MNTSITMSPTTVYTNLVSLGTRPAIVWYGLPYRRAVREHSVASPRSEDLGSTASRATKITPSEGRENIHERACYEALQTPIADPHAPLERIELSGKVLANNIAKAANYLVKECGVSCDDVLVLDLPCHWKRVVWTLAGGLAGVSVVAWDKRDRTSTELSYADGVLGSNGCSVGSWAQFPLVEKAAAVHAVTSTPGEFLNSCENSGMWPENIAALTLESFAFSWPSDLPSGVDDAAAATLGHADAPVFATCDDAQLEILPGVSGDTSAKSDLSENGNDNAMRSDSRQCSSDESSDCSSAGSNGSESGTTVRAEVNPKDALCGGTTPKDLLRTAVPSEQTSDSNGILLKEPDLTEVINALNESSRSGRYLVVVADAVAELDRILANEQIA